jgi:hypothetical protein
VLQDLAGLRSAKASGGRKSPEASPAKSASDKSNGNGHAAKPAGEFAPGTPIKYHDGNGWIDGVVQSLEPAVLKLADSSIIRTSREVLLAGVVEGIIVHV